MARKLIVSDRGNIVNLENVSLIVPTTNDEGAITHLGLYYPGGPSSTPGRNGAVISAEVNPEGLKLVIEWMRRNSLQAPARGEDGRFITSG